MTRKLTFLLIAALALPASAAAAVKPYDLNRDGRQDLVIGLPWWAEGDTQTAGAVAVVNGSKKKLLGSSKVLTRKSFGLDGPADSYTALGAGIASADFDGDGNADLAAGAPGEGNTGAVVVAYSNGRRSTIVGPASAGQKFTSFGAALVAGDLNRDGFADLVVGDTSADQRPNADFGAGAIYVFYGSDEGVTDDPVTGMGMQKLDRPRPAFSAFGSYLALGDTNRDKLPDVYEAAPGSPQWVDDPPVHGHFSVIRNADGKLAQPRRVKGGLKGGPTSLAIGDVDGDGYQDIVAGIPVDRFVGEDDPLPAGRVAIFLGGRNHLISRPLTITQKTKGVPGSNEKGDRFGSAVAVAYLDRDNRADIIVGARGEDGGRGRVTIIRGGARGYSREGNWAFDAGSKGIPGNRRKFAAFGSALSVLDLTGDGRKELVVGAAGDRAGGSVTVLRGVKGGFARKGAKKLGLSSLGQRPDGGYGFPELRLGRLGSS